MFGCSLVLAVGACSPPDTGPSKGKPVARVGPYVLYEGALRERMEHTTWKAQKETEEQHIQEWIFKRLVTKKGLETLDLEALNMEDKVNDYRYAILWNALAEEYIAKNLNREVSKEEVADYYTREKENFLLTENLMRYLYIRLPKSEPNMQRYARDIRQNTPESRKELEDYCLRSQSICVLHHDTWDGYINLLKHLPERNKLSFHRLKRKRLWTLRDDAYIYHLNVLAHRSVGELAPAAYVQDLIVDLILNQRRQQLQETFARELLEEATRNHEFTTHAR